MRQQWLDCSGNQSVLRECQALLDGDTANYGAQGRLIFVMGAPRAGASAIAKALNAVAVRQDVRSLALGEAPWGTNVNLRNHHLRSLQVPLLPDEFWSNELSSRPYEAVVALRGYQAVLIDDGHDYFRCNKSVARRNFDRILQLTEFGAKRQVFMFGLHDILEPVAIKAANAGIEVVRLALSPMPNDEQYYNFVNRLISRYPFSSDMDRPFVDIGLVHRFGGLKEQVQHLM
jgi:hypothetical protein